VTYPPRVHRAHYFFSRARWEIDQLGLAAAALVVLALVEPGADLVVAVDDSVFRRWGRKVWAAGWQHDGSSPPANKISYGNCFVTAGIIVKLPFNLPRRSRGERLRRHPRPDTDPGKADREPPPVMGYAPAGWQNCGSGGLVQLGLVVKPAATRCPACHTPSSLAVGGVRYEVPGNRQRRTIQKEGKP
jgi:DDE superfamily endonuclease